MDLVDVTQGNYAGWLRRGCDFRPRPSLMQAAVSRSGESSKSLSEDKKCLK